MTRALVGLLCANALFFAAGVGLLPLLGIARTRRDLATRAGLGYIVGIAAVGVLSANLALLHVTFGWAALAAFAVFACSLGAWRIGGACTAREADDSKPVLGRRDRAVTVFFALAILAFLIRAAHAFAVTPMGAWDSWAMWTMKARALAALGWANPRFFASGALASVHPRYPLFIPSLEAIDIRTMGGYNPQLIHLQFLLLALAFVAGLAGLLWDRVPALLLWPCLFAVVTAPSFLNQLDTAYADVPLAIFFATGAVAAARWLVTGEGWPLRLAALMFAAALLTKSEGTMLVAVVLISLAATAGARRLPSVLEMGAYAFAALVPWWVYIRTLHLSEDDYRLSDAVRLLYVARRAGRASAALRAFGHHLVTVPEWSLLVPFALTAICLALIVGSVRLPLFALLLFGGSLLGMAAIYDISSPPIDWLITTSAYRVVASPAIAAAALAPLLLTQAYREQAAAPYASRVETSLATVSE